MKNKKDNFFSPYIQFSINFLIIVLFYSFIFLSLEIIALSVIIKLEEKLNFIFFLLYILKLSLLPV